MSAQEDIAKANAEFGAAFAAGNAEGVANCYTENGWFMVPGAPTLKGREAITAGFQGLMDSGITAAALKTDELEDLGDTAIETGEYILYAGDDIADQGRFMVNWKNIYGKWYLHRDIINSTVAAAE
ncbi:MAG: SgcJ/EcaC family oxidoreductase [Kordiimonadaceae bacterium]|nr:SgcJ/EcaC family oxidoreductase [Kordiimonadaceae bacterium]